MGDRAMLRLPILLGSAAVLALVSTNLAQAPQGDFAVSFTAGSRDDAGRFMGGSEMRVLAAHAGRLYAGNGYWEDQPGPEGPQGAEILVLDEPGARWRVDHAFDERMPDGRPRDLAVSALEEVTFTTDGKGARLPAPVSLLIAANWDLTGTARVFSRDDTTGIWANASLAQDRPMPGFLPQVRSLGGHRDRVTGIDLVFAGQDPRGIFGGTYDPTVRAVSAGPPPRSSTSLVFRRRAYRVATAISGSAASPSAMAASTPRSGNRSMNGWTGRSRIGASFTPTPIRATRKPGCAG
jgi:hypothetical protein